MLPGLGTKDDITAAADLGVSVIRIATHCTEADISIQHFGLAREIGLETVGFLMMAHSQPPEVLADAGADHGRRRLPVRVRRRLGRGDDPRRGERAGRGASSPSSAATPRSASTATRTSRSASPTRSTPIRAGATQIDGSTRRFGAGAGNTPCEALAAVCDKLGIRTGIDVLRLFDVAEDIVRPVMDGECALDRLSLIMGYAGVYSSFLKHAYRAAERYGVSGADILLECGERRLVGGQEDEIIDIAVGLADAAR